jgi:hypothetical protein
MIKNERQYRITKAQAENFSKTIQQLEASPPSPGVHPLLHKAQIDAVRGQLRSLQGEVEEYDALRGGRGRKAEEMEG